jgi:hypothetical protein
MTNLVVFAMMTIGVVFDLLICFALTLYVLSTLLG